MQNELKKCHFQSRPKIKEDVYNNNDINNNIIYVNLTSQYYKWMKSFLIGPHRGKHGLKIQGEVLLTDWLTEQE